MAVEKIAGPAFQQAIVEITRRCGFGPRSGAETIRPGVSHRASSCFHQHLGALAAHPHASATADALTFFCHCHHHALGITVVLFDEGTLFVNPFHFKDALAADFEAPAAAEAALAIDPVDVPR
ncbi:hypothetical protein DF3PA_20145 [Candidatus Defluviicoccus seviourii]|uniref:Uncharacterized protein n=2 Tax=root TaxID=1 RepID=A0A564WCQ7_9PROT|nr:hypothetical protein DF3PB_940013 [uncultured Defluviicoccus sp.]VUX46245.1 hypothetical protein DF3PA_20145 [Candidatus Defluviicoccus seviourii]